MTLPKTILDMPKNYLGFFDLVDQALCKSLHLTVEEFEFFCKNASDEEIHKVIIEDKNFSDKKETVKIINRYKNEYRNL